MRLILDLLIITVLAAAIGLGLTALAVEHPPVLDAVSSGAWETNPTIGSPNVDAYSLAALAHRGEAPLAVADGFAFRAERDDSGRRLRGACTYVIAGSSPAGRVWTISLHPDRDAPATADLRRAFTSAELTRDANGRVTITVSSSVQPGDWLPAPPDGRFTLALAVYDTTLGALTGGRASPDLPSIRRISCR